MFPMCDKVLLALLYPRLSPEPGVAMSDYDPNPDMAPRQWVINGREFIVGQISALDADVIDSMLQHLGAEVEKKQSASLEALRVAAQEVVLAEREIHFIPGIQRLYRAIEALALLVQKESPDAS